MIGNIIQNRYEIIERLYIGGRNLLCLAHDTLSGQLVLLKTVAPGFAFEAERKALVREYEVSKDFAEEEGLRASRDLITDRGQAYLVLDYIEGLSLANYASKSSSFDAQALSIMKSMAEAVANLHERKIIHRDINPRNILIEAKSKKTYLIDFELSFDDFAANVSSHSEEGQLIGSVHYVSPEQTGLVAVSIDYRSDLYALGASYYHMLCGKPPFEGESISEILHAHVAKKAPSPNEVNSTVPIQISDLVMKLLEKDPAQRYQSALAVVVDLEYYSEAILDSDFPVVQKEPCRLRQNPSFQNIQIDRPGIYKQALQLRDDDQNLAKMFFLSGEAGIGKSSISQQILDKLTPNITSSTNQSLTACEIRHKFEISSDKSDIYDIFAKINSFFKCLKHQNYSVYNDLKNCLQRQHPIQSKLFPHMLPDLLDQVDDKLSAHQETNDIGLVYFLRDVIFLTQSLVDEFYLFFDDIQWADYNVNILIREIAKHPIEGPMICIISMRTPEKGSLLNDLISGIRKLDTSNIAFIDVVGFSNDEVSQYLDQALGGKVEGQSKFIEFLKRRTRGNPFYIKNIIQSAHLSGALFLDRQKRSWIFEETLGASVDFGENLIGNICLQIDTLGSFPKKVLQVCSVLGNPIHQSSLISYFSDRQELLFEALELLNKKDFLIISQQKDSADSTHYIFSHDQVQEAAYSSLDCSDVKKISLELSQIVESDPNTKNNILLKLKLCNTASDLITDASKRAKLANLNYNQALQLKSNSSYRWALSLAENSLEFLDSKPEEDFDEFCVHVFILLGQLNCLIGNFKKGFEYLDSALASEVDMSLIALVADAKCRMLIFTKRYNEVLEVIRIPLRAIGMKFPKRISVFTFLRYMIYYGIKFHLNYKSLLNAKPMSDELYKNISNLLVTATVGLYYHNSLSVPIMDYFKLLISLRHGVHGSLVHTFTLQMSFRISTMRFKSLALFEEIRNKLRLKHNFDEKDIITNKIGLLFVINHWMKSFSDSMFAYESLIGDLIRYGWYGHVSSAYSNRAFLKLAAGKELSGLQVDLENAVNYRGSEIATYESKSLGYIKVIQGGQHYKEENPKEEGIIALFIGSKDRDQFHHDFFVENCVKTLLYYLKGDYKSAHILIRKIFASSVLSGTVSLIRLYHILYFFCVIENYKQRQKNPYLNFMTRIYFRYIRRFFGRLAKFNPENFEFFKLIVDAEISRVQNKPCKLVIQLFQKAVSSARANGALLYEAILTEHLAEVYLDLGDRSVALNYLKYSYQLFSHFGARIKLGHLLEKYPDLEDILSGSGQRGFNDSRLSSLSTVVDIPSIQKATFTIASEIQTPKILNSMMKIIMEESGARDAALVFKSKAGNDFSIEASYSSRIDKMTIKSQKLLDEVVPVTMIREWGEQREPLIIGDFKKEQLVISDPYFRLNAVRSFACIPIFVQTDLRLLIILSNDLIAHTFQSRKTRFLEITGVQLCVAIDNSILYQDLKKSLNAEIEARSNEAKAHRERLTAEREKQSLLTSMESARVVQTASLEIGRNVSDWDFYYSYTPAEHTGGDWFGRFVREDAGRMYIAVADVAGHGLSASLVSTLIAGSVKGTIGLLELNNMMSLDDEVKMICQSVNHAIYQAGHEKIYSASCVVLALDLITGEGCLNYCGHPPVVKFSEGSAKFIPGNGPLLGLSEKIDFNVKKLSLSPGESLFLYTDGVFENSFDSGKPFMTKKALRILGYSANSHQAFKEIEESIKGFNRSSSHLDDTTILVVGRKKKINRKKLTG